MQVTQTNAEGLKREYSVVVPAADIDDKVNARLEELRKTANINGFRPGKVPVSVIRKRYGQAVVGEVVQQLVNDSTMKAMEQDGVRPAMAPDVEVKDFKEGADLEYSFSVEALPEIEQPDLGKLAFTRQVAKVTDKAIDDALGRIAAQNVSYEPAPDDHQAAEDDQLVIDFKGTIDGEPFEGGSGEDVRLVLGSDRFIAGFEEQLKGARKGDSKTVSVTFPEDYPAEAVAGKAASFAVEIKAVEKAHDTEVNDAFAEKLGLDDLEALRTAVSEQLAREYKQASRTRLKRQILDKLAENNQFSVPEGMVEREFHAIWHQIEDDMKRAGTSWEESEQSEEDARAEYRAIAERRVRLGLLLSEVGRNNNITVPQDEINRAVMEQARQYPGQEKEVFDFFKNNPSAMNELQAPLYEDKVIDFITEMATIEEEEVAPEVLLKPSDDDDDGTAGKT